MKPVIFSLNKIFFFSAFFLPVVMFAPVSCIRADQQENRKIDSTADRVNDSGISNADRDRLFQTLSSLPAETASKIKDEEGEFLLHAARLFQAVEKDSNFFLFPVGKSIPLPDSFEPSDLVPLDGRNFKLNKNGMHAREILIDDLDDMINAAASEGIEIMISSAYRSYSYQKNLFDYYTGLYGEEETGKFSARPGTSQHQLGTALDFGSISMDFRDTDAGRWMADNGWKFGFSLSYPEGHESETGYQYEPWHFRYITREGTALERKYFLGLQFLMLGYLMEYGEILREITLSVK